MQLYSKQCVIEMWIYDMNKWDECNIRMEIDRGIGALGGGQWTILKGYYPSHSLQKVLQPFKKQGVSFRQAFKMNGEKGGTGP